MSIQKKLITLLLVIAGIPLVLISVLSYTNAKATLQQAYLSRLEAIADLKLYQIDGYFRGLRADIDIATNYFNVRTNLPVLVSHAQNMAHPRYEMAKEQLDRQLKAFLKEKELRDIMLVDMRGKVVYALNDRYAGWDLGRPLPDPGGRAFSEGKERVFFTDIFPNPREEDAFVMLVAAPVRSFSNQLIGVVVFEIDMQSIYRLMLDADSLGKTGEMLIGKLTGNEVLFLSPLRHDKDAALRRSVPIGVNPAYPIQSAVKGHRGAGVSLDYRGEQVIAAWRHISAMNWGLVAKIDTAEAWAPANELRNIFMLVSATMLIIIVLAAAIIARSFSRPILALQQGAEIIGQGDLSHRVGTKKRDEIGQLSRIFDRMVEDLQSVMASRDELNKEMAQRRRAEEELKRRTMELADANGEYERTNAILHGILSNLYESVVLIDEQGIVQSFNPTAERMFGYREHEVIGQNVKILMPEPYRSEHDAYLRNYQNTGRAKIIGIGREVMGRRKDGAIFPAALGVTEMRLGERRYFIGAIRDITDIKIAVDELKTQARELARSNTELQQFAYIASHDLQEPLRLIASYLQLIVRRYRDKLDKDGIEFIDFAVSGANRMKSLIQGLLEYSRVQSSSHPYKPVDLDAVVQGVRDDLALAIEESGAVITSDILPVVPGHESQLRGLFQNLIDNSIKYRGTLAPRIHISATPLAEAEVKPPELVLRESWLIAVKDNGTGLGMEFAERIFLIFQRLHGNDTHPGSGLGLALCRRIVERHGGLMWVNSRPGEGATFYWTLPMTA